MDGSVYLTPPRGGDLWILLPELVLLFGGMLLLLVEMFLPRRPILVGLLGVGVLIGSLVAIFFHGPGAQLALHVGETSLIPFFAPRPIAAMGNGAPPLLAFHGNLVVDGFSLASKAIVIVGSLLSVLLGLRYAERFRNPGEFFALIVFATGAAVLLCGAADLLMIYLAIEFLSITSYIVVGYLKFQPRSTEASMKYFLYGAITAAVMLYGMSLLYGMSGSTALYPEVGADGNIIRPSFVQGIMAAVQQPGGASVIMIAMIMVLVGFGFKVAMAPFHQWVPDVYDGAPLPVMAWLSVASKAAGLAVLVRVFYSAFPQELWTFPIAVLAALTMTAANLAALPQSNIKRMLAYSSVAHAGYTLMAVVALGTGQGSSQGSQLSDWQKLGVVVYLATYVFMNLGALAVVTAVYNKIKSHRVEDYAGLAQRAPGLAWLMLFFMLSLAGIPPTAGFWGKFVLFAGVLGSGPKFYWLAIVGFVNTVISVFYYWNVVRSMFLLKPPSEEEVRSPLELKLTLGVAAVATLLIFLLAGQFMALFASS